MKRRVILILIVLAAIAGLAAAVALFATRYGEQRLLKKADVKIQAGRFDEAVDLAEQYITREPEKWQGYFTKARALSGAGRYEDAREPLRVATERSPATILVPLALAQTYAIPARRLLSAPGGRVSADTIREALVLFEDAGRILDETHERIASDSQAKQDLRLSVLEQRGLNRRYVGFALAMLSETLLQDAETAEATSLPEEIAKARRMRDESRLAEEQSGAELGEAIVLLMSVLKADVSRDVAAAPLVGLCARYDPEALEEVRKLIGAATDPPAKAATALAEYDLALVAEIEDPELMTKRLNEIDASLEQILQQRPSLTDAKLGRIRVAIALGDNERAESLSREILKVSPRNRRARRYVALLKVQRGELKEAERELFSLRTDHRDWIPAHLAYAEVARSLGEVVVAGEAMRTVTELDPGNRDARTFLAEYLMSQGFHDQALEDARACYAAHRDDPDVLRLYSRAALGAGQRVQLLDDLRRAEKEHAQWAEMLVAVLEGYEALRRSGEEGAAELADALAERLVDPEQVPAQTLRDRLAVAQVLLVKGRASEAEELLRRELLDHPNAPSVHMGLGQVYATLGRTLDAEEHYRAVLKVRPKHVNARLALAESLLRSGSLAECQAQLEEIPAGNAGAEMLKLRLDLERGMPLDTAEALKPVEEGRRSGVHLAGILLRNGRPDECIQVCESELKKNPDDANLRLLIGQAHFEKKDFRKCVEQWRLLVRADPQNAMHYARLAGALGRLHPVEQVIYELNSIPGAREEFCSLAVGQMLFERAEYADALSHYAKVAGRPNLPDAVRGAGQLRKAECLLRTGAVREAVSELTKLAERPSQRVGALLARARLFVLARRADLAAKDLAELEALAVRQDAARIWRPLAGLYLQIDEPEKAFSAATKLVELQPQNTDAYVLVAEVLRYAGRADECAGWYKKAVAAQPGSTKPFARWAQFHDAREETDEALAVLDQLEKLGQTGRRFALFERGRMFARWGLPAEALEQFEQLSELGWGESPALRLWLGRSFASMGKSERATAVLSEVPRYAREYVPAQRLLASLAPTVEQRRRILRSLAESRPGDIAVPLQEMSLLMRAQRAQEAVALFDSLSGKSGDDEGLPVAASYTALRAMIQAGDRATATDLAIELARGGDRNLRQLAIVLAIDERPEKARELLPSPDRADVVEVLLGLVEAGQRGDAEQAAQWSARLREIESEQPQSPVAQSILPRYAFMAKLIGGEVEEAAKRVTAPESGLLLHQAEQELVESTRKGEATAIEAARLLKVSIALDGGLPDLGRTWAMEALASRPRCQWAAAMAYQYAEGAALRRKILELLQPKDCLLAQMVEATLAGENGEHARAAALYGKAAREHGESFELVRLEAAELESAGKLPEALELYRKLYMETKQPDFANNIAYVLALLYPKDPARLEDAARHASVAVEGMPTSPLIRDTAGWIAYLQGDYTESRKQLRRAVKGLPQIPEVHYHLGMAEAGAGNDRLARWHLAAAVYHGERTMAKGGRLSPSTQEAVEAARAALADLAKSES
jgi:tetratricopeptide (TPR) repeat protein